MTTEDGTPAARSGSLGDPPPPAPPPPARDPGPRAGLPAPPPPVTQPATEQPDRGLFRRRPKQRKSFLRELPGIVLTALVISVLIKTFLVQAFYIPSGSMENTLLVNDRVLVNKLADKPDEIHRGDVVVFRDPGGWLSDGEAQPEETGITGAIRKGLVFVGLAPAAGEEDLIKRVIGVGGDHIEGRSDGAMLVNGVQLDETYVFPGDKGTTTAFTADVPEGRIWVMGDHRSVSQDSRAHQQQEGASGYVPVSAVIGRAFTIVWPLDRAQLLHHPATFDRITSGG